MNLLEIDVLPSQTADGARYLRKRIANDIQLVVGDTVVVAVDEEDFGTYKVKYREFNSCNSVLAIILDGVVKPDSELFTLMTSNGWVPETREVAYPTIASGAPVAADVAACFTDQRPFPWHELSTRTNRVGRRAMYDQNKWNRFDAPKQQARPFPVTYGEVMSIGRRFFTGLPHCGSATIAELDSAMERAGLLKEWRFLYVDGRRGLLEPAK